MDPTENLIPGESIEFETRKHWIAPLRDSLIPAGLLVIAYVVGLIRPDADGGLFGWLGNLLGIVQTGIVVVAIGWEVYNLAVWRTARFAVTNLRVLRSEGLVQRRTSETLLTSVTDVRLRIGVVGRQLGYGDLQIFTGSGEGGSDTFRSIAKPAEFRNAMMTRKLADKSGPAAVPAAPAAASAAPPAATTAGSSAAAAEAAEAIRHLAELRDQGLVTAEEFEAKKAELLARM
jgi:uncharacterized membrane protein YdbT with pleckstrin-like domain